MTRFWLRKLTSLIAFLLLLAGCEYPTQQQSKVEEIRQQGVLRVGTLNNQLSYYIGQDGPTGLDYELAAMLADELGVTLEMRPIFGLSGLFPALDRGEIDLIAAGLTITPERMAHYAPAPAYYFASQVLVYKNGQWRPRSIEDLASRDATLKVTTNSSHEATLNALIVEHPELSWETTDNQDGDELLKMVAEGTLDYTIADSVDVAIMQRTFPEIAVALELSEDQPIGWYLEKGGDDSLHALIIEFFGELKQSGGLAKLEERYFGHVDTFDYVDTRAFIRALEDKLPEWQPLFEKYAGEFDWKLIAALAYQESHWNPNAVSPTGVRGMMMLTLPTAKSVGVKNRLDPEESIRGGALYLSKLIKRIPDSIDEHEKVWFALASYNVGFGHVMDARRLTRAQGGDPDAWADVKQRLPLLRKRQYYSQTRYGYARGDEALKYVENIRRYYQSITGYFKVQEPVIEEVNIDDIETISPVSAALATSAAVSAATSASSPTDNQSDENSSN
ncbi:membrane-bound lytic murein transglycosylase MltF [Thaumasiovibrio subtropicus]|uniref:membrane-bound lytic murein transglycosylase MltF n=1 Tax=Thaumasiovibrio subtropicus TaxID=1891207 RepID=UPI000B353CA2|nr:membrane-bound lytic murein transglycosylase MltF [Thaumasiovibrio subtropicus]